MTPAAFQQNFGGFADTSEVLIGAKLNQASARMGGPAARWGSYAAVGQPMTLADLAQGNYAAHLLQIDPTGNEMRIKPAKSNGRTTYLDAFDDLVAMVCGGPIVAGGGGPRCFAGQVPYSPQAAPLLQPGTGTVGLTQGSAAITFTIPQNLSAGTLVAFGPQPGVYYVLPAPLVNAFGAMLSSPYTGPTTAAALWAF